MKLNKSVKIILFSILFFIANNSLAGTNYVSDRNVIQQNHVFQVNLRAAARHYEEAKEPLPRWFGYCGKNFCQNSSGQCADSKICFENTADGFNAFMHFMQVCCYYSTSESVLDKPYPSPEEVVNETISE